MKTLGKIGLFFGITFVFTILLAIGQQALGLDTTVVSLPQFGPGIAAIIMMLAFKGDHVTFTVSLKRVSAWKYVVALGLPLVVPGLLFLIYNQFVAPLAVPTLNIATLAALMGGILVGAFGEEVGWRGYAQNLLGHRLNQLAAFLIVGVLWGVWHIGNFQYGPAYMLFYLFSTVGYSGVMGWLLLDSDNNVLLATLFHAAVNVGFYILQNGLTDMRLVALNGVVWLATAVLLVVRNPQKFLRVRQQTVEPAPEPTHPRAVKSG